MEFVVPAADPESFFPVDVSFSCSKIYCDLTVDSVGHSLSGAAMKFVSKKVMQTAGYQVV
jgi:hypothetical protein